MYKPYKDTINVYLPDNALCSRTNWFQILITFVYREFGVAHLNGV